MSKYNTVKLNESPALYSADDYEKKIVHFLLEENFAKNVKGALEESENVRLYENQTMQDVAYDLISECYSLDELPSIIANNIDYERISNQLDQEGSYYRIGTDIYEYVY